MQDLYKELEQVDIFKIFTRYEYKEQIEKLLRDKRDEHHNNGFLKEAKYCQIEIDTFNFRTTNDSLSFKLAGTDNEGNPFEYPNIRAFQDEDFDYLIERLNNTENLFLKARYSHVLWHSPKKHFQYAQAASQSYLDISKILFREIDATDSQRVGDYFVDTIENAILISDNLKDKEILKASKDFMIPIVHDFNYTERVHINTNILYFMIDNNKLFRREDINGLQQEVYKIAQTKEDFRKIDLLQLGKKVDIKLGNNYLYWDKEIAECYEVMATKREDEANLASTLFIQDAIKYYKLAKEENKIKELSERYQYLKENMKLGHFSTKIDVTEVMEIVQKFSEEVSNKNANDIFPIFMYNKSILPTYDELESKAKEQERNHPMDSIATISIIDDNGHVSEYISTPEEHKYYNMLRIFSFSLQFSRSILLREIIFKGISNGNINTSHFIQFMREKTWLGQNIKRTFKQGKQEVFNWLNMLVPAINDYFVQLYFYITNQSNHINLTLCIDSLTIKLEGILRDMVNLKGGTSFFFPKDKSGKEVVREKDINALLHDEIITNLISKDDLIFLKYLLVEKAGLNLRNKICHSFFRHTQEYEIDYMNLLLLAVLRLAKNEYCPFPVDGDITEDL